ncbi:MAG: hypothetical protein ACR2IE_16720 [Candidatus Sumerlaeaceae bacterium]
MLGQNDSSIQLDNTPQVGEIALGKKQLVWPVSEILNQARTKLKRGNDIGAIELCNQVVVLEPGNPQAQEILRDVLKLQEALRAKANAEAAARARAQAEIAARNAAVEAARNQVKAEQEAREKVEADRIAAERADRIQLEQAKVIAERNRVRVEEARGQRGDRLGIS